jgi:hypothetical protein
MEDEIDMLFIAENEKPWIARLKLFYLVPLFIIVLVPACLYIGFCEYGIFGFRVIWNVIRHGRV